MMIIDGNEIQSHYIEYGVLDPISGDVLECDDEADARLTSEMYSAVSGQPRPVVMMQVYETGWSVISE